MLYALFLGGDGWVEEKNYCIRNVNMEQNESSVPADGTGDFARLT